MLSDRCRSLRSAAKRPQGEGFVTDTGNVSTVNAELKVASLQRRIAGLVAVRQELRERGATGAELERNRAEIAETQHELSRALIELYGREPGPREALV